RNGEAAFAAQADEPHRIHPEDAAMIFFTSGATGGPKGVVIPHRSAFNSVNGVRQCVQATPEDKVLAVAPSHHVFAALVNILLPLANGSGVTYLRELNSAELLSAMAKAKVTIFPAAPQVFHLLHKKIFDEAQSKPFLVRVIFRLLLGFCYWTRRTTGLNP